MPKIVDHDAYRRELLARSYQAFVKLGYDACTMRVLAKEIGVSTGTLYHYFATKEDLFEQLVRLKSDESRTRIERIAAVQTKPMSCSELFAIAADFAKDRREQQLLLMEYRRHSPERAQSIADINDGWLTWSERLLDIHDRPTLRLVVLASMGAILMTTDRSWFTSTGALLDELLSERTPRRDAAPKTARRRAQKTP